ncbi:tetratricopeptide repeat protein [Roseivirga spongicola]|uniref:tetratricopeptide repeat protein n=1 Tax=Roseivirga spongicola TaxID=333140 RepID=UPI002AC9470C|nr:tetratricopeptide repeat protein [Roseivirga spongicola]WPZ11764.1 tetratricopeptide repeat protein [Roseivirga spongicola]
MSDFELIEEYLSGKLSPEEKRKFRSRLLNDPAFNQEFQELKEIRLQVRQSARNDIKSFFDGIETSIEKGKTTKDQTVMKKVISIAASLVLIAAISYIGLRDFNSPPSNQELFNQHFTSYNSLTGQVRGTAEENLSLEDKAFMAFDAKDFYASEEMLTSLVAAEPSAMNYFYLGASQLELGKAEEAIKNLNTVINNYSGFKAQSEWYLALAHLKNNDEDATIGSLANVITRESEYKEKAKSLLEEMGYTLNTDDMDSGPVIIVVRKPPGNPDAQDDAPDGSSNFDEDTRGRRLFQYGIVSDMAGEKSYSFMTDQPIDNLGEGDLALFVVVERKFRRFRGRSGDGLDGRAFILDKY